MNIKILDTWLKEFVKTAATPDQIGECLSLTSVSVERIEKYDNDFLYDIEVTTNRPDLMSIVGLAREAAAVLPQFGFATQFIPPQIKRPSSLGKPNNLITIEIDSTLINRICAVVMDVTIKDPPEYMKKRLEASGIRSLNNLIDVTNYVMREIGHPVHVFDYDRIRSKKIIIRQSRKAELLTTLDKKTYVLAGGDIVADDGTGTIIDLLGIMGTENSVVTDKTKRIVLFLDNNDPYRMRKTSMSLAIRTEAAMLNEKGVDPELALPALLRGIELYQKIANGKLVSQIIDLYPNKVKPSKITITQEKIEKTIGIPISLHQSEQILIKLGFRATSKDKTLTVHVPSSRAKDVTLPEDIIEEIARVYGYHKLPSILPPFESIQTYHPQDEFYWEKKAKDALKYWGFTENYTYSFVSQALYEGPLDGAVALQNPLTQDLVYMRKTIVPSLLHVVKEHKKKELIRIFEIANVYHKKDNTLPDEVLTLAAVVKSPSISFFHIKGILEQLLSDLGITNVVFKTKSSGGLGADMFIEKEYIGNIEVLEEDLVDFEVNFETIAKYATSKKIFKPLPKYPPVIEDLALVVAPTVPTGDIIAHIEKQSSLITEVTLLDQYESTRTFHIVYQHSQKNLTNEEVAQVRKIILKSLKDKFRARLKE